MSQSNITNVYNLALLDLTGLHALDRDPRTDLVIARDRYHARRLRHTAIARDLLHRAGSVVRGKPCPGCSSDALREQNNTKRQ
jgi:hypothetical protein